MGKFFRIKRKFSRSHVTIYLYRHNLYPLSVFACRGYELGYELCFLGAKRCTLRQTQGNKKSPTNH